MSALVIPDVPPANTPAWYEWRRCGIGASEVAATIGEHPWLTERALALHKRGLVAEARESEAMRWGHRMEAVGAEEYAARTGRALVAGLTFRNPRWPYVFASPDRAVIEPDGSIGRLVELKWTNRWEHPPRHVRIQGWTQTRVAEASLVDVVRMGPYGEPHWTPIERDDAESEPLLDWANEWYERYVLGDELPPEDGSPESRRVAERSLAAGRRDASDDEARLVATIAQARQDKAAAEQAESVARAQLTTLMAGFDEIDGPGFHVAFVPVKGRTTVDWKAVAEALAPTVGSGPWGEAVAANTTTGEPSRRFTPTWH